MNIFFRSISLALLKHTHTHDRLSVCVCNDRLVSGLYVWIYSWIWRSDMKTNTYSFPSAYFTLWTLTLWPHPKRPSHPCFCRLIASLFVYACTCRRPLETFCRRTARPWPPVVCTSAIVTVAARGRRVSITLWVSGWFCCSTRWSAPPAGSSGERGARWPPSGANASAGTRTDTASYPSRRPAAPSSSPAADPPARVRCSGATTTTAGHSFVPEQHRIFL